MLLEKMLAVIAGLNKLVAERGDVIWCMAIALLTKKNFFVLGKPGHGKSYIIKMFFKCIANARLFTYLLTKQTDETQLFGHIGLSTLIPGNPDEAVLAEDSHYQDLLSQLQDLKSNSPEDTDNLATLLDMLEVRRKTLYLLYGNKPKLVTAGKIPECDFNFLDEIFKSNDAVLNALLTVINEHEHTNEGVAYEIPAQMFGFASNEIPDFTDPEQEILRALFDRLHLKVVTQDIESREERLRIQRQKKSGVEERVEAEFTLGELCAMQQEVKSVFVPDSIDELIDDIFCELRRLGIHVSDRTLFEYHPIVRAQAWLNGRTEVVPADLAVLKWNMWTKVEEIAVIEQVLERFCVNPIVDRLKDITDMATDSYDDYKANADAKPTPAIMKLRGEFLRLYEMLVQADVDTLDGDGKNAVAKVIEKLEKMSKTAHKKSNRTYAPLPELLELQGGRS